MVDALTGPSDVCTEAIMKIRRQMADAVTGDVTKVGVLPMIKVGKLLAWIVDANYWNDPAMDDRNVDEDAATIVRLLPV